MTEGTTPSARPVRQVMAAGIVLVHRTAPPGCPGGSWRAEAIIPHARQADWVRLDDGREAGVAYYHAGTLPLELHRTGVAGYRMAMAQTPPVLYVILRQEASAEHGIGLHAVTASAFDAQGYGDSGEDIVEPVPAPASIQAWIRTFCNAWPGDETFVKRRRTPATPRERPEAGRGDIRIRQPGDVYLAPRELAGITDVRKPEDRE